MEAKEAKETIADIVAEYRDDADKMDCGGLYQPTTIYVRQLLNRIEAARKREAEKIERIVRDAVMDYNEMYCCAPNDDAEREIAERAETANEWLNAHEMETEPFYYSKEETPCL